MKASQGWRAVTLFVAVTLLLAACATPTPEVIIQTAAPIVQTAAPIVQTQVVVQTEVVRETQVVEVTAEAPAGGDMGVQLNPDVSGEVELWHFWASPVRRNAIRRVIAMCQAALPNISVVDTVKPFGDIWTANIAAVAAGSGMPDVIVSDRPTIPRDAGDGVYMNLQEWADRDGITRDQFYGWAWDQTVFEGDTYGIPHETDVRVLFWNKQLFEAAGLDPNDPPDTWSEVEAAADALDVIEADGTIRRVGFMPLWNAGFDIWSYANDAEMIAEDATPQINNPKAVETLEWIKTWVDRYGGWQKLQDFRAQFGAPPNDLFMGNGVAMVVDIFGYNSQLEFYRPRADVNGDFTITNDDPRMDWGIAVMPHADEADPGTWSGGFSMSIPEGAEDAEAAWEFIKCATGPQGQASWARDTQAQPTNIAAAQDPVLSSNPLWTVVDQSLAVSTGGVVLPGYPNWGEQLGQRYEQVWTGALTPQEMLDEAQAAVEAEID